MKLTVNLKLLPTAEQDRALLATLERANEACDYISGVAWRERTFGQFKLHRLVYVDVRERFGLSAQMAVRCIAKVADAYKLDRKVRRDFRPHGGIAYDSRILRFKAGDRASIWTLGGRVEVSYVCGERQRALMAGQRGESDLVYHRGTFYLNTVVEVEEPEQLEPRGILGVDLGIVSIAVTSDGESFAGGGIQNVRARNSRLRARLQAKGTKSATRLLRKRGRRERRFQTWHNHNVSKSLVTSAKDTARGIALEELKGIRSRVTFRRAQRTVIHSWAFAQLGSFIDYKAKLAGVPVYTVDPRNTSRTCSVCGVVDKASRKSQAIFLCGSCGLSANADHNAAINIARRGEAMAGPK